MSRVAEKMTPAGYAYAVLVRAFPRRVYASYGAEMLDAFVRERREVSRTDGSGRAMLFSLLALADVTRAGLGERWRRSRAASGRSAPSPGGPGRAPRGGWSLGESLAELRQDLALGLRGLVRSPGFAGVAVLSLALGIGVNTALFSATNALWFTPVPGVNGPDRVSEMLLQTADGEQQEWNYPDFRDVDDADTPLEYVTAWKEHVGSLGLEEGSVGVRLIYATPDYFRALGVVPSRGRDFVAAEGAGAGQHRVVIISHSAWQTRFGGAPDIVGRTIALNRTPYAVVGLAPEGFRGHRPFQDIDFWVPMTQHPYAQGEDSLLDDRDIHWVLILGRLREGASLAEADAALDTVFGRIMAAAADSDDQRGARAAAFGPIPAHNRGQSLIGAGVLFALVGLVLLIICGNVAGMALARSATREREIAVRLALGSSRARLVRYLMGEALVLALAGGGLGVIFAFWGIALALPAEMAMALPDGSLQPNASVLAYSFALTLATVLAFGLLPALRFSRPELLSSLKDDVGGGGRRVGRVHRLAASAQTGVALVALVVCSLFVRALGVMEERDLGFEPSNLMVTTIDLSVSGYDNPVQGQLFVDRVRESVAAVPGVTTVSIGDGIPLDLIGNFTRVSLEAPAEDTNRVMVEFTRVSEDFFDAIGTPLLRGRGIERTDDEAAERVVVITRALADRLWPDEEAVGQRLWTSLSRDPAREHTVIGVVPSVASSRATEDWPHIFLSQRQNFYRRVMVVVRTTTDAGDFVGPVQDAILDVDRALSPPQMVTSLSLLERSTESQRGTASMAGGLGVLALILSAIGVYGVVGFAVANRTREIGLRMAIGATRPCVVRQIMGDAVRLAVPGLIVGALVAGGSSIAMQSMMFGLSPIDPIAFGGSALVLFAVVLVASLVPARRASAVDPSEALRAD